MEIDSSGSISLLKALQSESENLLNGDGIFPVMDFGWEDHHTPNSEYVGLAMWTMDAPYELDWERIFRGQSTPVPTPREKTFLRTGQDFVGTMNLARNAMGVAKYSIANSDLSNIADDEEPFWEYRAIAAQWLNIAADRIREYFIMARFGKSEGEFNATQPDRPTYARPFQLRGPNEGPGASAAAVKLIPLVRRLMAFRRTRNGIVHKIASRVAENAVGLLVSQIQPGVRKSEQETPNLSSTWDMAQYVTALRGREMSLAFSHLKDWYLLLVQAGALAFEFEYWKRIGK
jgi:hypothetical protein